MAKLPKYLNTNQYDTNAVCDMIAKAVLADPNYADMLAYTLFASKTLGFDTSVSIDTILKSSEGQVRVAEAIASALYNYSKKFEKPKAKSGEEGDDGSSLEKN